MNTKILVVMLKYSLAHQLRRKNKKKIISCGKEQKSGWINEISEGGSIS